MKILIAALLLLGLTLPAHARNEAWYKRHHCTGITEHVLPDRTRVDCLTDTHSIEYDWGPKWAEGIGQALGYAKPARQCATERQAHVQFLARLVGLEMSDRKRKMIERRIKAAKFSRTALAAEKQASS